MPSCYIARILFNSYIITRSLNLHSLSTSSKKKHPISIPFPHNHKISIITSSLSLHFSPTLSQTPTSPPDFYIITKSPILCHIITRSCTSTLLPHSIRCFSLHSPSAHPIQYIHLYNQSGFIHKPRLRNIDTKLHNCI